MRRSFSSNEEISRPLLRRGLYVLLLLRGFGAQLFERLARRLHLLLGGRALLRDLVEFAAALGNLLLCFGQALARALEILLRLGQFLRARGRLLGEIRERPLDARDVLREFLAAL